MTPIATLVEGLDNLRECLMSGGGGRTTVVPPLLDAWGGVSSHGKGLFEEVRDIALSKVLIAGNRTNTPLFCGPLKIYKGAKDHE